MLFKLTFLLLLISFDSSIKADELITIDTPTEQALPNLNEQAKNIRDKILNGNPKFTLVGEITKSKTGDYAINEEPFVIDSDARIVGELKIGSSANVRGDRIGGRNYAKRIIIGDPRSNPSNNNSSHDTGDIETGGNAPKGLPGQKLPKE